MYPDAGSSLILPQIYASVLSIQALARRFLLAQAASRHDNNHTDVIRQADRHKIMARHSTAV
jgi:hypothetical protein